MNEKRPIGITIAGIFAVIAGLGEVVVGFTGNYLGILSHSLTPSLPPVLSAAFIVLAASVSS